MPFYSRFHTTPFTPEHDVMCTHRAHSQHCSGRTCMALKRTRRRRDTMRCYPCISRKYTQIIRRKKNPVRLIKTVSRCVRSRSLIVPSGSSSRPGADVSCILLYVITCCFLLNFYRNSYCSREKSPRNAEVVARDFRGDCAARGNSSERAAVIMQKRNENTKNKHLNEKPVQSIT